MSTARRLALALAASWERYWFRERSLLDLAIARIVLTLLVLYLDWGGRVLRVALVEAGQWAPVGLVRALGIEQPGMEQLAWLDAATRTALFAACFGVLTNVSLAIATVLQLLQEGYLNCLGKVTHATLPMLCALLFLAISPCGRRLSIDAAMRRWWTSRDAGHNAPTPQLSCNAGWPFDLLFVELAAFYFQAGSAKLAVSGLAWVDGYSLQFYLLQKYQPAGLWLAEHLWLCSALSTAVLVLELTFPLGVFFRRLRPFFLVSGFLFHLGTTVFLDISFWPLWALYVLFLPWSRLLAMGPRPQSLVDGEAAA